MAPVACFASAKNRLFDGTSGSASASHQGLPRVGTLDRPTKACRPNLPSAVQTAKSAMRTFLLSNTMGCI